MTAIITKIDPNAVEVVKEETPVVPQPITGTPESVQPVTTEVKSDGASEQPSTLSTIVESVNSLQELKTLIAQTDEVKENE